MTVQVKVVSLLPSATEMIALLRDQAKADGSGDIQLVGRSHECDWPEDLTAGAAVRCPADLPACLPACLPA